MNPRNLQLELRHSPYGYPYIMSAELRAYLDARKGAPISPYERVWPYSWQPQFPEDDRLTEEEARAKGLYPSDDDCYCE